MQGRTSSYLTLCIIRTHLLFLEWLSYDTATVLTTSAQPGETITFLQAAPANLANIPMKVIARRPEDVTLYLGMPTVREYGQKHSPLSLT